MGTSARVRRQSLVTGLLIIVGAACIGLAAGFGVSQMYQTATWVQVFAIVAGVEAALVFAALCWFIRREKAWYDARESQQR
jgi:hypothetical protein